MKNPHLVQYYGHVVERKDANTHIFWILIELGTKGTLWDMLADKMEKKKTFSEKEILKIVKNLTASLIYVHSNDFIHCDFKVENILVFEDDTLKLCDFGSVNTFDIDFKTMDPSEMYIYEEIFEKQTTMMYRPPEMCDPYLGYKVNSKADLWMLGCVMFTLMFFKHPFAESSKLCITGASYKYPVDNEYSFDLEIMVRNLLTPNPDIRPDAHTIMEWLEKLDWKANEEDKEQQVLELNPMALEISHDHNNKHQVLKTGKYRKYSPDIQARNRRTNKKSINAKKSIKANTNSDLFGFEEDDLRFSNPVSKRKQSKNFINV